MGKQIVFSDDDLRGVKTPYNDVVVITVVIANFKAHKIMIDSGSIANVLFYDMFLKIKCPKEKLMLVQCPLYWFNRDVVIPVRLISLLITLRTAPRYLNLMLDFSVAKVLLVYNVILGKPCIRMAKVILSTYHLIMKFLIEEGIREVRENYLMATECYFTIMKGKQKAKERFIMSSDNLAEQRQNKVKAAKGVMKVKVDE